MFSRRAAGEQAAEQVVATNLDQVVLVTSLAQPEFTPGLADRVLAQAEDADTPLLERLRFICIVSSNLDEFFEIRVAGLKEQAKLGGLAAGPDGLAAAGLAHVARR